MDSFDEILSKFSEFKKKLDGYVCHSLTVGGTTTEEKLCKDGKDRLEHLFRDMYDPQKICHQVIEYLGVINNENNESFKKVGCVYLYYWIYNDLLKDDKKGINHMPNIYDEFIKIFKEMYKTTNNFCNSSEETIKKEDLPKLTVIYEMYKNKEYIEEFCLPNTDDDYCNVLKEHIKKYNNLVHAVVSEIHTPCKQDALPSRGKNIGSTIIITIFATLLISIFLFVLYEFTTFGSWIRHKILRRRKGLNNIEEKLDGLQGSELFTSMPRNSNHNMLYNSPHLYD
ncbi:variable surface protein [Plasmodium gonderi]|uniref:Variable surface protein n=1 Tax=Plasmodium gonderi TaxID=77519 RepID=A0A1Y1JNV0_PLAGO|nr:variable surface protein [Plasmodium gonderi]GAW84151.1 variable surface protein [Plasmodium gonderi]